MGKQEDINQKPSTCPVTYALNLIGGKWKLPILWALNQKEVLRYSELKRTVLGITNMMLSQSLKELQENGLITRVQYMEMPPRVEYSLTKGARNLQPTLLELAAWGTVQMERGGECGQPAPETQVIQSKGRES